jgi:hypothetical protein
MSELSDFQSNELYQKILDILFDLEMVTPLPSLIFHKAPVRPKTPTHIRRLTYPSIHRWIESVLSLLLEVLSPLYENQDVFQDKTIFGEVHCLCNLFHYLDFPQLLFVEKGLEDLKNHVNLYLHQLPLP